MRLQNSLILIFSWFLPFSVAFGQEGATCTHIKAEEVLFVTHPSSGWDKNEVIKDSINEVAASFVQKNLPVIRLKRSSDDPSSYYLRHLNGSANSEGGDHRFCVEANEIFISGGKFSMCSSETVRDIIVNARSKNNITKITYLMQSIYEPQRNGLQELGVPLTLEQLTKTMSDAAFLSFLNQYYFTEVGLGQQNPSHKPEASFQNFTFEVVRDGRSLLKRGAGSNQIILNFDSGIDHSLFNY